MSAKRTLYFILCFSVLFISRLALAAAPVGERLSYPVHFISVAPEIDGRLDEPFWQSLPETTGFYVLGADVAKAKQTSFKRELPLQEVKVERVTSPVIWKETAFPIFSRYPGGTFARGKLTSAAGPHVAPRLSPCGKKVLFNSFRGGRIGIWMVDYKGEGEERITDGEEASWSPDGEKIIFSREGRIVERVLASGEERMIGPPGLRNSSFPGYSPDGKKIIFIEEERGIFILEPGEELRHLVDVSREVHCAPRWSPDGKRIAFQDRGSIYVMGRDGSNRRRLTTAGGIQASPIWSLCGKGIAYCQASNPDGPWDLYIMGVDGREPRRRLRRVDLGPDWQVEYFGEGLSPQIGSHLQLRELGETSLTIENDWFTFSLSPQGTFLLPQEGGEIIELILLNEKGERLLEISRLQILRNDGEEIIIEAHYYQRALLGRPVKIAYRVSRTRPLIEVLSAEEKGRIYIQADMDFFLLPDRLASDLILDPSRYFTPRVPLPSTDLALGLLGSGNSLLLVSSEGGMELTRGEQIFTGLEVSLEGENLSLAILTGEGIWDLKEEVREDFSPEIPGIYRLALYDEGRFYTRILSAGKRVSLPEGWRRPELAISYLYGRTERTPSHLLTVIDLMKEIEKKPLGEILEREGLLAYRILSRKPDPGPAEVPHAYLFWAPVGVPQRLTAHRPLEDWSKYPHISFIIESLRDMSQHPHGKEHLIYLCGIVEKFIERMDKRLVEYRNFSRQIDSLLEMIEREGPERGEFMEDLERTKKALNVLGLRLKPIASLSFTQRMELVKSLRGRGLDFRPKRGLDFRPKEDLSKHIEKVKAGKAAHASFNILFEALVWRRELIREYKALVLSLRDSAGIAITRDPAIREWAEEIRKLTEVIGRRHFLEKKELMVIFSCWGNDQERMAHALTLLLE